MRLASINPDEFRQEPAAAAMLKDVKKTMEDTRFPDCQAIVAYIYGENNNSLYCIIGNGTDICVRKLLDDLDRPVGARFIFDLYENYQTYFGAGNNQADTTLHPELSKGIFECWFEIYHSFIEHFANIGKGMPMKEILCKFEAQIGHTRVSFSLPMFHNLSFRYGRLKENKPLYFTMVTDESFYDYFEGRFDLPCPKMADIVLLRGLRNPGVQPDPDPELQRAALFRDQLLEKIDTLIMEGGGLNQLLKGADDFKPLFSKSNKRNVIQLLTHHKAGKMDTYDGAGMSLSEIVNIAMTLRAHGDLHDNIVLDALTCENDKEFLSLKAAGIKRIYYSYNLLSTDLAVCQLYELYSGKFARDLGWRFPYIDGTRPLHMLHSDITRVLYVTMNMHGSLDLP